MYASETFANRTRGVTVFMMTPTANRSATVDPAAPHQVIGSMRRIASSWSLSALRSSRTNRVSHTSEAGGRILFSRRRANTSVYGSTSVSMSC
jgi:hypothetical protein